MSSDLLLIPMSLYGPTEVCTVLQRFGESLQLFKLSSKDSTNLRFLTSVVFGDLNKDEDVAWTGLAHISIGTKVGNILLYSSMSL